MLGIEFSCSIYRRSSFLQMDNWEEMRSRIQTADQRRLQVLCQKLATREEEKKCVKISIPTFSLVISNIQYILRGQVSNF